MIFPDRWTDQWVGAWNSHNLEELLALYSDDVELRSPMARLYANSGIIISKARLRDYWSEVIIRVPRLTFEKVAVYGGHESLSLHYIDNLRRNCIETFIFNSDDKVSLETACLDKLR